VKAWIYIKGTSAGTITLSRENQFYIMFDLSNRWIDYYLIDNIQRVSRRKNLPIN